MLIGVVSILLSFRSDILQQIVTFARHETR